VVNVSKVRDGFGENGGSIRKGGRGEWFGIVKKDSRRKRHLSQNDVSQDSEKERFYSEIESRQEGDRDTGEERGELAVDHFRGDRDKKVTSCCSNGQRRMHLLRDDGRCGAVLAELVFRQGRGGPKRVLSAKGGVRDRDSR